MSGKDMSEKALSVLIGYLFGCFLTAEVVAKKYAGKSSSQLGLSGNPGMVNIMSTLGFVPGMLTLLGDVMKCALAMLTVKLLFPQGDRPLLFYAGFGCALGHCFPFWRGFKGGKGAATTCALVVLYSLPWGLIALLASGLLVIITKYLCLSGPLVPLIYALGMFLEKDYEAAVMSLILSLIALRLHWPFIMGIRTGTTRKDDVLAAVKRKLKKKNKQ